MTFPEFERTHILCTARELIDRSGWHELRLEELLQRSGLCDQSFRRHFSCLDGLLVALLAEELSAAAIQLRNAAAPTKSATERIQSYTAKMIDYVYPVERRGRASMLASIWLDRSGQHFHQIDALIDELVEPLREAIRVGCRTGEMSSERPADDAQSIFHLVTGMILTQAALGRPASPDYIKTMVMNAVARALRFTVR